MTTQETILEDAATVGQPYRAKDITMAATVDVGNRTVLLTGAIDTNEHDILVRVELPSAGIWHVVKSETNLTDQTWNAWQITLGEGSRIVPNPEGRANLCQQYQRLHISESRERFCFYDGEIRPGEPILKQFTIDTVIPRIVMSHNRNVPTIENTTAVDPDQTPQWVLDGLKPKPYVESWVPARIV